MLGAQGAPANIVVSLAFGLLKEKQAAASDSLRLREHMASWLHRVSMVQRSTAEGAGQWLQGIVRRQLKVAMPELLLLERRTAEAGSVDVSARETRYDVRSASKLDVKALWC